MKRKFKIVFSAVLAMSMLLTGCGSATTPTGGQAVSSGKSDIVIAINGDFVSLDPADTNDTLSCGGEKTMIEGLFGFDDDMKVIPLLATGYTANDAANEFTITLRQGVEFTDGAPWNADAAIVNFNRLADQKQGLKRNSLFKMIDHTEKLGDYEIKIVLKEPFGAMINTLAHPAAGMVSPKSLETYGKEVSQHPVGTGMYKFVEWRPGESLKIEKNEKYWGGEVGFNSVTFKPVTESSTRVSMLQSGDADFIFPVPTENIDALKADSTISFEEKEGMVVRYLFLNNAKAPFNNIKVRQALNYAIDKDAYSKVVWNGLSTPTKSIIGPSVQFYKENDVYKYNVEKAKELLKEAGYADGFTTNLWVGNSTFAVKSAEFMQQQLALVGVTVNIKSMDNGTIADKVTGLPAGTSGADAGVEMYTIGWSPSTGDADWGMRPIAATESFPPVSYNISYYSNPSFDEQMYAALKTADKDKRAEAYKKAQDIVWNDAPMVWLGVDHNSWALKNTVQGISVYPDGAINLTKGKPAQ